MSSRGRLQPGSSEIRPSSGNHHRKEVKAIEIDGRQKIWSVASLIDGEHVVSYGWERKVRCWRVEDGREVRPPISAGSVVRSIAVSRDGKWFVTGTASGRVTVWNVESGEKVTKWKGHGKEVRAVDVSPEATKIATGSYDLTACVWSFSTGERLLDPLKHIDNVAATKFSPNGRCSWKLRLADLRQSGEDSEAAESQPKSTRQPVPRAPGPKIASDSLLYLPTATSIVSMCALAQRSRNGPFTAASIPSASSVRQR